MIQSTASFILCMRKGLERLNATRTSVAGDGLTEPNLYLLPLGADANESLPVYQINKRDTHPGIPLIYSVLRTGGTRKGGTSGHTGAKIESWRAIFRPWESP